MKNFDKGSNYKKGGNSRGRDFKRGGSGKSQFGSRDRERPQMHGAVCSDCGKRCEVPFRPTGNKPVYCNQCFSSHKGSSAPSSSGKRDYGRSKFQDKKMFDAICDKCGKRFHLPFNPTGDKPVYCNQCFGTVGGSSSKNGEKTANQHKEQFDMLNAKLDRIIEHLTPAILAKKKNKEAIVKKEKVAVKKKGVIKKKEIKAKKSASKKKKVKK